MKNDSMYRIVPPLEYFTNTYNGPSSDWASQSYTITTREALSDYLSNPNESRFVITAGGLLVLGSCETDANHCTLADRVISGGNIKRMPDWKPDKVKRVNGIERTINVDNADFSHTPTGPGVFTNIALYLRALGAGKRFYFEELNLGTKTDTDYNITLTRSLDIIFDRISPEHAQALYISGFADYPEILNKIAEAVNPEDKSVEKVITIGIRLLSDKKLLDTEKFKTIKEYFSLGLDIRNFNTSLQKDYVSAITNPWDKAAQKLPTGKRGLLFDASKKAMQAEAPKPTLISRL